MRVLPKMAARVRELSGEKVSLVEFSVRTPRPTRARVNGEDVLLADRLRDYLAEHGDRYLVALAIHHHDTDGDGALDTAVWIAHLSVLEEAG